MTNNTKKEYHNVLRVHRDDVRKACGIHDGREITDQEMQVIADKLGDALLDSGYWVALEIIGENELNLN